MPLSDLLGLNTTAGTQEMQDAIDTLQKIGVPNAAQLTLPELQRYVKAGVLTPQQYSAISENPQAYSQAMQAAQDNSGKTAQSAALQQLGTISQAGGSSPINQANLENNINQTNQAMQAARGGIQENAQERGVGGGGLSYINQLMNEQSNAAQAHEGAVQAGANNAQLGLQALANQGTLGGTMQGQANQSAQAQAQAAAQIAQYNSQLQSQANQYNTQTANEAQAANLTAAQSLANQNTGNANYRTEYNAQVPQTIFSDQMQKATGVAGAQTGMAKLKEDQATNQNNFTGNLIGAAGTAAGAYYGGGQGAGKMQSGALYGGSNGPPPSANTNQYKPYSNSGYAAGGEIPDDDMARAVALVKSKYGPASISVPGPEHGIDLYRGQDNRQHATHDVMANMGGEVCYAEGGEVHDHTLCMQVGGQVPGESQVPGDSETNDTIDAKLSPHEIVLPTSVTQGPNPTQDAAQFVGGIKGTPPGVTPTIGSFAEALKVLEANGLELRLTCANDYSGGQSNAL